MAEVEIDVEHRVKLRWQHLHNRPGSEAASYKRNALEIVLPACVMVYIVSLNIILICVKRVYCFTVFSNAVKKEAQRKTKNIIFKIKGESEYASF